MSTLMMDIARLEQFEGTEAEFEVHRAACLEAAWEEAEREGRVPLYDPMAPFD